MLDQARHRSVLVRILKEIYTDSALRSALGFKGGTAAHLFYDLPRLSVDLDFDLLGGRADEVFGRLGKRLEKFGKVKDARQKRNTIFFLVDYGRDERKVKIELSKRPTSAEFEVQNYLGIPVRVTSKASLAAGKLAALIGREKFAARDLFDLWFFLDQDWPVDPVVFREKAGITLKKGLTEAVKKVKSVKDNQLLQGLGKLLESEQKRFVKEKLKEELVFLLKLYQENLTLEVE